MGSVNRDIVIAKMWIYINGHIWILTSSYTAAKKLGIWCPLAIKPC